jgi:hypothetical protein
LEDMIFWSASFSGPKAVPGNYKVQLNLNGENLQQDFTILPNPAGEATLADMQKQFDFIQQVNTTNDKAHKAIKSMRLIREKLAGFEANFASDASLKGLVDQAKAIQTALLDVEKTLYQTQNRSNQDPLNFPIKLTNKLAHLNRLVGMDDFGPTRQDEAVREALTKAIDEALATFEKIKETDVKSFNLEFSKQALDYLTIED